MGTALQSPDGGCHAVDTPDCPMIHQPDCFAETKGLLKAESHWTVGRSILYIRLGRSVGGP